MRKIAFLAALAVMSGCERRPSDAPSQPVPVAGGAVAPQIEKSRATSTRLDPVELPPPPEPQAAPEFIEHITEETQIVQGPPPTRDLDQEFAGALGDVSSCAASLPSGERRSAHVVAYLMQTGRISRAEVSGIAEVEVARCVRGRAEGTSIRGPIADAPRSVQASVTLTSTAPAAPPREPSPFAPGYVAPATALPARVDALPRGQARPAAVLPAVVDSVPRGRSTPPGAQEPGVVLPALGPAPASR